MSYLQLCVAIVCTAFQTIVASFYNRKNADKKAPSALYNLLLICALSLIWGVLFLGERDFEPRTLWYSLIFGVCFSMAQFGLLQALRTGPMALTSLFIQFSVIGAAIWGFFFWDSPITALVVIGLVLVCISLVLCLYSGKGEKERSINAKWLIFALIMFAGNMGFTVAQKQQQMDFSGQHGNQTMFFAMLVTLVFYTALYLRSDKSDSAALLRSSWHLPVLAATMNLMTNLCIMLLATSTLSPNLIYPAHAVMTLALTTVFSAFVFKERLGWWQWVGIAVGAVATILLSI